MRLCLELSVSQKNRSLKSHRLCWPTICWLWKRRCYTSIIISRTITDNSFLTWGIYAIFPDLHGGFVCLIFQALKLYLYDQLLLLIWKIEDKQHFLSKNLSSKHQIIITLNWNGRLAAIWRGGCLTKISKV